MDEIFNNYINKRGFGAGRQEPNQQKGGDIYMKETTDINGKHPIIIDFIMSRDDVNGCGYFRDDEEAVKFAQTVGKNQERKFRKYGIVPKSLVRMMGRYFVFQGKNDPTYRNITYGEFLTLLIRGPYKNEAARQVGEKFYHDLLVKEMTWLNQSFAMADSLYNGMRNRDRL